MLVDFRAKIAAEGSHFCQLGEMGNKGTYFIPTSTMIYHWSMWEPNGVILVPSTKWHDIGI